jgi:1-acyl-sn-glycerol-3-phosphate acyltransferase
MTMSERDPLPGKEEGSQWRLLGQRRFGPFYLAQLLGAANDNLFKFGFTLLASYGAGRAWGLSAEMASNLIAGLFVLPFLLFSATAGQMADRWPKAWLMRAVKGLEVLIMGLGAWGFCATALWPLLAGIALLGIHSATFGPAKYAYLPEELSDAELVGGNGLVEMGTFVAILAGSVTGGALIGSGGGEGARWLSGLCMALALVGFAASWFIPARPAKASEPINWNPVSETWRNLASLKGQRAVFLSLMGVSWLWFFGAALLAQFAPFAKDTLGAGPAVSTALLCAFSLGIGVGSALCEKLSGGKIELGLVPFGSIGMSLFALDLAWVSSGWAKGAEPLTLAAFWAHPGAFRLAADLTLLAAFAGFYSVPLYAIIQSRCAPERRARVAAANNILNSLFMLVSAGLCAVALGPFGWSEPRLFAALGVANALVAIWIYRLMPEFLMRFLVWLGVHAIYRFRKGGLENIPAEGPAVIALNHVSFVDALIALALSPRPPRFVMDSGIFKIPVLSFIFRQARAIPIAPKGKDPETNARAFEEIARALEAGELVAIFPEGAITRDGELAPLRPGIMKIVERTPAPVIPMALGGLWGSFFSRKHGNGRAMSRPFAGGWMRRITARAGAPMPEGWTLEQLRERILELRGERL